jgi:hypothetical protein
MKDVQATGEAFTLKRKHPTLKKHEMDPDPVLIRIQANKINAFPCGSRFLGSKSFFLESL